MARRRAWEELAPAYRGRLASAGVTRETYASGASLASARGHAGTPERPIEIRSGAGRNVGRRRRAPAEYGPYLAARYPDLVTFGTPPALGSEWATYHDPGLKRAVEYADAIGNPDYIKAFIQPDGSVILKVRRPRR